MNHPFYKWLSNQKNMIKPKIKPKKYIIKHKSTGYRF